MENQFKHSDTGEITSTNNNFDVPCEVTEKERTRIVHKEADTCKEFAKRERTQSMTQIINTTFPLLHEVKFKSRSAEDVREESDSIKDQLPPINGVSRHSIEMRSDASSATSSTVDGSQSEAIGVDSKQGLSGGRYLQRRISKPTSENVGASSTNSTDENEYQRVNQVKKPSFGSVSLKGGRINNMSAIQVNNRINLKHSRQAKYQGPFQSRPRDVNMTGKMNIVQNTDPLKNVRRSRSITTNIPPLPRTTANALYQYPMAFRYLRKWAGQIKNNGRARKPDLENLSEQSEESLGKPCTLELLSRFPSSPEFAQVLHDLCRDLDKVEMS